MTVPYRTPRFRYGQRVTCERRGEVVIVGLSDAPVPWPIGQRGREGARSLVLYGALAEAVRNETAGEVARLFGVVGSTVNSFRHALGCLGANNKGTIRRLSEAGKRNVKAIRAMNAARRKDDAWKRKIAAARKGKRRPRALMEKLRRGNIGRKHSVATRRRMSEAAKRRVATGKLPPAAGRAWTAKEEGLVRRLPPAEVARRTGRTLTAIWLRRRVLGLPDGRATNGRKPATR